MVLRFCIKLSFKFNKSFLLPGVDIYWRNLAVPQLGLGYRHSFGEFIVLYLKIYVSMPVQYDVA